MTDSTTSRTSMLKRVFNKAQPKECLIVNATFRFAPDDPNHNEPSNTQLKRFLNLKKSNVVLSVCL